MLVSLGLRTVRLRNQMTSCSTSLHTATSGIATSPRKVCLAVQQWPFNYIKWHLNNLNNTRAFVIHLWGLHNIKPASDGNAALKSVFMALSNNQLMVFVRFLRRWRAAALRVTNFSFFRDRYLLPFSQEDSVVQSLLFKAGVQNYLSEA